MTQHSADAPQSHLLDAHGLTKEEVLALADIAVATGMPVKAENP